ncbi:7376_t:CDS:2 [Entrophospora sp. SA101]|nr:7376_t:CDS:2 [Entrophospora sp. SA101]
MVKNNNLTPIEANKKPFETVQELKNKNETPSLEEFMESYESDDKVSDSYNDEVASYSDIGVNKSYGPTTYGRVHTSRTSAWFSLEIGCYNCAGNELLNVDCTIAYRIRSKCAELIKDAIQKHERGQKVEGYVKSRRAFFFVALFFVAFLVKVYLRRGYLFLTPKEKKEREELQNEFKSFQAREEHREHLKRGIDYDSKCSICSNT